MCGIFGFSFTGKRAKEIGRRRREVIASVLSVEMDKRGGDSWGWYRSMESKRVAGLGLMSENNSASDLIQSPILLAHTRLATQGEKTVENAHPFDMTSIVGAHNGIISNHDALNEKHRRTFAVDSMHVFAHLAENLDLKEIEGYGAIAYIRKAAPGRVYFCAWNSGDLSIWKVGNAGVIWASTEKAVMKALRLTGLHGKRGVHPIKVEDRQLLFAEDGGVYDAKTKLLFGPRGYGRMGARVVYGSTYGQEWLGIGTRSNDNRGCGEENRIWGEHSDVGDVGGVGDGDDEAVVYDMKTMLPVGDSETTSTFLGATPTDDYDFRLIQEWFLAPWPGTMPPPCVTSNGYFKLVRAKLQNGDIGLYKVGANYTGDAHSTCGYLLAMYCAGDWFWSLSGGKWLRLPVDTGLMIESIEKVGGAPKMLEDKVRIGF